MRYNHCRYTCYESNRPDPNFNGGGNLNTFLMIIFGALVVLAIHGNASEEKREGIPRQLQSEVQEISREGIPKGTQPTGAPHGDTRGRSRRS